METPQEIFDFLLHELESLTPELRFRQKTAETLELCGLKETMQGKQKVDGFYFASAVLKPKDCRLYFFPIYTHTAAFEHISPTLRKMLKGKSCFHLKKLNAELQSEISLMLKTGLELYQKDDLI
jgi:hypothetical protein